MCVCVCLLCLFGVGTDKTKLFINYCARQFVLDCRLCLVQTLSVCVYDIFWLFTSIAVRIQFWMHCSVKDVRPTDSHTRIAFFFFLVQSNDGRLKLSEIKTKRKSIYTRICERTQITILTHVFSLRSLAIYKVWIAPLVQYHFKCSTSGPCVACKIQKENYQMQTEISWNKTSNWLWISTTVFRHTHTHT